MLRCTQNLLLRARKRVGSTLPWRYGVGSNDLLWIGQGTHRGGVKSLQGRLSASAPLICAEKSPFILNFCGGDVRNRRTALRWLVFRRGGSCPMRSDEPVESGAEN